MRLLKKRRWKISPLIVLGISLICLVGITAGLVREFFGQRQINRQVSDLEQEISQLESENSELGRLITEWSSGRRLEREARQKLGLKKPGEKVVVVNRRVAGTSSAEIARKRGVFDRAASAEQNRFFSNFLKWWEYFFK